VTTPAGVTAKVKLDTVMHSTPQLFGLAPGLSTVPESESVRCTAKLGAAVIEAEPLTVAAALLLGEAPKDRLAVGVPAGLPLCVELTLGRAPVDRLAVGVPEGLPLCVTLALADAAAAPALAAAAPSSAPRCMGADGGRLLAVGYLVQAPGRDLSSTRVGA
jgi:hypothetical protein